MHGIQDDLLLRPDALSMRPAMKIGRAHLDPATRCLEGPEGRATLEPRTLQLLVALAEAEGQVVSRAMIEARCWGVPVSEDTLNQAIASLRRAARAAGGFRVETIPRTGYRLVTEPMPATEPPAEQRREAMPSPSRRALLLGGAAVAGAGGLGLVAFLRSRPDPRVADLLLRGQEKLRYSMQPATAEAAALFAEAAELAPQDSVVWGWRARATCRQARGAAPDKSEALHAQCELVLDRAEELDPRNPNVIGARALLPVAGNSPQMQEDRFLAAHAQAPGNTELIDRLEVIAQAAGRTRSSLSWNTKGMAVDPDMAGFWWKRALKLWIMGDWRQSDLVIDHAMQRWPRHPVVWNARLTTLAFSNRAAAGLQLIADPAIRATGIPPELVELWRLGLVAITSRSDIAAARAAFTAAAPSAPGFAVHAVMFLSALGELDAAYAVAEGFLFHRGPLVGSAAGPPVRKSFVDNLDWANTQWLFMPATAAFRADPRFPDFARDLGLVAYWKARGAAPDPIHGVPMERFQLAGT